MSKQFVELGRKIVAVGRNYSEHIAELGNAVPKEPLIFFKPTTSYLKEGGSILVPDGVELDHEVELGVVIGKGGSNIKIESAMDHVSGYALALDMTARNLQTIAKSKGLPWTLAKGQDTFCPISGFIPKDAIDLSNTRLWLSVDGQTRQDGNTKDMIFSVPTIISYISKFISLEENDLILTGTPSGVGLVKPGQKILAGIGKKNAKTSEWDNVTVMSFPVKQKSISS